MRSFSDDLPGAAKTATKEELAVVEQLVRTEVAKLRADVSKAHFWLYISIASSIVFAIAAAVVSFLIHH